MFTFIKNALGLGETIDFAALVQEGAQIVDVRTKDEFQGGHIKGSVNIPLQVLTHKLSSIRKDKTVIVCCASGARSASAKGILTSSGFSDVHNGGGWRGLQGKLNR